MNDRNVLMTTDYERNGNKPNKNNNNNKKDKLCQILEALHFGC